MKKIILKGIIISIVLSAFYNFERSIVFKPYIFLIPLTFVFIFVHHRIRYTKSKNIWKNLLEVNLTTLIVMVFYILISGLRKIQFPKSYDENLDLFLEGLPVFLAGAVIFGIFFFILSIPSVLITKFYKSKEYRGTDILDDEMID